jgi:hypothetical protein
MPSSISTHFTIETEPENDNRWIAEILEIPGVLVYDLTQLKFAKKTVVGVACAEHQSVSVPRDLIGSETLPLPICL